MVLHLSLYVLYVRYDNQVKDEHFKHEQVLAMSTSSVQLENLQIFF